VPTTWSARDRPDLGRVVGFISQPQLITCDFSGASSPRECLMRVRDAVLEAGKGQRLSMSQCFHVAGRGQGEIPIRISMNYLPPLDVPSRMGQAGMSTAKWHYLHIGRGCRPAFRPHGVIAGRMLRTVGKGSSAACCGQCRGSWFAAGRGLPASVGGWRW
jgi:hypothetical protein